MHGRRLAVWLLAGALAAQQPTCRLEGRVVDARFEPVVAATLTAECDGAVIARTQCDAAGIFVFGRLPQDRVLVRATTPAPDVGAVWVDLLGEPSCFVRVVTMPARVVSGIVRDDAGQPVASAWVVTGPCEAGDLSLCTNCTTSDAEGRYRLTHVPFGRNVLRAWAPDHDAFEGTVDGTSNLELECRVERQAAQERIFVLAGSTAQQRAAARLEVRVLHAGCQLPLPPALRCPALDADGAWSLRGWSNADEMRARVLGSVATGPKQHTVPGDVGRRRREFEVAADAAARLVGRLVGEGSLGALTIVAQALDDPAQPERVIGRTREDGSFDLPAPVAVDEKFALRVLACPYVVQSGDKGTRAWFSAAHKPGRVHAVPVGRAHQMQVRISSPTGEPTVGARVLVYGTPSLPKAGARPVINWLRSVQLAEGVTDSTGTETIRGLELQHGEALLCTVQAPEGYLVHTFDAANGDSTNLDLTLAPAAALDLLILDANGQPAPGARVSIFSYASPSHGDLHAAADRSGRILVRGLRPDMHALRLLDEHGSMPCPLNADEVTSVQLRIAPR